MCECVCRKSVCFPYFGPLFLYKNVVHTNTNEITYHIVLYYIILAHHFDKAVE